MMTREEAAKNAEILKAFSEGKDIQILRGDSWVDIGYPSFVFDMNKYRIKPEPKYVPFTFKDSKLFRDKWVYLKAQKTLTRIIHIADDSIRSITIGTGDDYSYSELLSLCTFEDGSPCGKLVE